MDTATARNAEKEYNQLVPIRDFLARRFNTGEQIPEDITPRQLLDLKRGLGADHVHNWNPDVNKGVTDTAKSAYHEMAEELHRVVPGTADLDNTISNLIPVVRRAELADTSAGVTQRIADRIGRPTGGMLGAATGAFFGGPLGAVVGTVLPDLVSAPALKMAAARGMYSPITGQMMKPLIGAGLNLFDRPDQQ
jgi:tetrahydromethanopterin S-methyltransferase subunit G